jgi:hypothetical protein
MLASLVLRRFFGKSVHGIVSDFGGITMRRTKYAVMLVLGLFLTGCGQLPFGKDRPMPSATPPEGTIRPKARPETPETPAPPISARTPDQFDTTTAKQRQDAATAAPEVDRPLGETVASLGDPSRPGFWLETPLVTTLQKGRVVHPATGKSAQVTLIPIGGPKTAGSRISLAAMRLIEVPLTDLATLQVFIDG